MKVKAASRCQRRHWVREWNRMSSVSSGFRRTTRLESCPTRGTDAADRPCHSDGVQQSLTGGVDMPKKAPNEANLKLKQSSESQAIKSRNGRGGGAKTKPIGHGMGRAEVATRKRMSTRCRRKSGTRTGVSSQ